jgi:hypothetical protein
MPYDNAYNRGIANELGAINRRFAVLYAYSPVDGQGSSVGGSNAGVLFQIGNASKRDAFDNIINDNMDLPPVYYYGQDAEGMKGGSAFAEGTYRDTGFDKVLGADSVGAGMYGGDAIDMLMKRGMSKAQAEQYATDQGYYDNPAERAQRTSEAHAAADAEAEANKPKTFWQGVGDMLQDVAEPVAELAIHALGAGQKKRRGRPRKVKNEVMQGGSILGNHDPYPRQGDSVRLAGRGKGKAKKALESANGALLAMPDIVLANGVPPKSQLRGQYGGGKKAGPSSSEDKFMDKQSKFLDAADAADAKTERKQSKDAIENLVQEHDVKKKKAQKAISNAQAEARIEALLKAHSKKKGAGKNLSGMTDRRIGGKKKAEKEHVHSNDVVHIDVEAPNKIGCGKRQARAALVKKIMKDRGVKMIEASSIIKKEGLTY